MTYGSTSGMWAQQANIERIGHWAKHRWHWAKHRWHTGQQVRHEPNGRMLNGLDIELNIDGIWVNEWDVSPTGEHWTDWTLGKRYDIWVKK